MYTVAEAELKQSNQSATGYFEYLHEWLLCDVNHSVKFHLEVNGMFVDGSEKESMEDICSWWRNHDATWQFEPLTKVSGVR